MQTDSPPVSQTLVIQYTSDNHIAVREREKKKTRQTSNNNFFSVICLKFTSVRYCWDCGVLSAQKPEAKLFIFFCVLTLWQHESEKNNLKETRGEEEGGTARRWFRNRRTENLKALFCTQEVDFQSAHYSCFNRSLSPSLSRLGLRESDPMLLPLLPFLSMPFLFYTSGPAAHYLWRAEEVEGLRKERGRDITGFTPWLTYNVTPIFF